MRLFDPFTSLISYAASQGLIWRSLRQEKWRKLTPKYCLSNCSELFTESKPPLSDREPTILWAQNRILAIYNTMKIGHFPLDLARPKNYEKEYFVRWRINIESVSLNLCLGISYGFKWDSPSDLFKEVFFILKFIVKYIAFELSKFNEMFQIYLSWWIY